MKKQNNNQQRFTLIKILVVLAILGFIMAMATARFRGISAQAIETAGRTNEAKLTKFITAHTQDHGKYPGILINKDVGV
jgi:type II secretory pathway pseudopilin PulG